MFFTIFGVSLLSLKFLQVCMRFRSISGVPEGGFDCVVMDPPWENKSAKRSGHYPTLPSRHLLSVPIARLLKQARLLSAPAPPHTSNVT
jgi:hypothetical protein